MTTVRELIATSLKEIAVIGAGENMTAEDANDGLVSLNQMISMWSADGAIIYSKSKDFLNLNSGQQNYTMGPTGDINTVRPVSITQATITLGGVVTGMNIWSSDVYSTISLPALQGGIPSTLFVNNTYPLLNLSVYPSPTSGQTLTIYSLKPLGDLSLNDTLALPPGYEAALRYNLAVWLAPQYEREARKTTRDNAYEGLQTIKRNNQQYYDIPMVVDPVLDVRYTNGQYWGWGFNIYGGF